MQLQEEARQTEDSIGQVRKISDLTELRQVVKHGLESFDKLLRTLSATQKEEVLVIYLERVRRMAFGLHLASLKREIKRASREGEPTREKITALLERYDTESRDISRLYRFL